MAAIKMKVPLVGKSEGKVITNVVVAARILNATLVVPKLDQKSFWKDSSTFSEIFDVEWFISSLSKDVKVIKELPHKGGKVWVPYNMRVPRKCNERCYQIRVLPVLLKKHTICCVYTSDGTYFIDKFCDGITPQFQIANLKGATALPVERH
ncbi:GDP-fucose protein O-fucosyltransferase [Tanacetum coccineum]